MPRNRIDRRQFGLGAASAAAIAGFPAILRAQNAPIKLGMPTILSGRVAQLGISTSNAAQLSIDAFNAAGGLDGRPVELLLRDSKAKPDEAARVVRDLVNSDRVDAIFNAEASSASFAVQEVVRETGTLCLHVTSETSSLTADPAIRSAQRLPLRAPGHPRRGGERAIRCGRRRARRAEALDVGIARLRLWARQHRPVLPRARRSGGRGREGGGGLAETLPARLHRGDHADPAKAPRCGLQRAVGRRPGVVHRPGVDLRHVRRHRLFRHQSRRLHDDERAPGIAGGAAFGNPLHREFPRHRG